MKDVNLLNNCSFDNASFKFRCLIHSEHLLSKAKISKAQPSDQLKHKMWAVHCNPDKCLIFSSFLLVFILCIFLVGEESNPYNVVENNDFVTEDKNASK